MFYLCFRNNKQTKTNIMYTIFHHANNFSICVLESGLEIIFDHNYKDQFLNYLLETKQITKL